MIEKLKQFAQRPDSVFLLAALLTTVIPVFLWGESVVIDFFGYTIFIGGKAMTHIIAIFLFSYWILYRMLSRYLVNRVLTWGHIIITIGLITYFLTTGFWYAKSNVTTDSQAFIYGSLINNRARPVSLMSVKGIIFIIGQLMFVVNFTLALIKKKAKLKEAK